MTDSDWTRIAQVTRLAIAHFALTLARETGNPAQLAFARGQLAELKAAQAQAQNGEDDNGG